MEIVSGRTGSPHVTSQQFRQLVEGTVGQESYILTSGENLEPELASNNILKIRSGMMSHHGNISSIKIGTYDEIELTNGSQGMKRIDLVVNRYTRNAETNVEANNWVVITGTPVASDPAVPAYTAGNLQDGDLTDDCPVFEVHYDGLNVTEIKKLLDVADNLGKMKKELAELNGKTFNKQLSATGLTARSNRCSIQSGGYFVIGNMCYFQLKVKILTTLAGPNYWSLIDGLPRPILDKVAAVASNDAAGGAARAVTVEQTTGTNYGNLVYHNQANASVNDVVNFSGFYMIAT